MTLEFFEEYNPRADAAALLGRIVAITRDYSAQGFVLTLRQLYYQLVTENAIRNEERQYKRVGDIVSRARRSGYLDWEAIEDRVRRPTRPPEFDSLDDLVEAALSSYRLPRLRGQDAYVELWVEKDALAGVLQPIARNYHVTLMVNRGYSSTSAMKAAGERIRTSCTQYDVRRAYVLYLGDHDPSGEDMVRDVSDRLDEYTNQGYRIVFEDGKPVLESGEEKRKRLPRIRVGVEKLALTIEQVEEYDPPPNPTKLTDSRAAGYVAKYGDSSWEVDALPPKVLRQIIEARLDELIDADRVEEIKEQERSDKRRLKDALKSLQEDG